MVSLLSVCEQHAGTDLCRSSAAVVNTSWQPDGVERAPANWKERIQLRLFDCISALPPAANNAHYSRASEWSSGGGSKRQGRPGSGCAEMGGLALFGAWRHLDCALRHLDWRLLVVDRHFRCSRRGAQRQKNFLTSFFSFRTSVDPTIYT